MKKAMTLFGPVPADQLGHILPHEHIFSQFPKIDAEPLYPDLLDRKVTLELLGRLRRDIWSCKDNLSLQEPEIASAEVASFKACGGGTIVDVTTVGLGRNIEQVAQIARQTGVHVIGGTGYYTHNGHPASLAGQSVEAITIWMIQELTVGIEGTPYRAGVIGEIGISTPVHPDEAKVLQAALAAQKATRAPLSIHQHGGAQLEWIHAQVQAAGVDPHQVILCHMGSASPGQRLQAAARGYYVEIDCFGNEYYLNALAGEIIRDPDRVRMVKELAAQGYLQQILISNDIALKMLWKKYGGWSYEHLIVNMKPFMLRAGLPPKSVDTLLYYNPMRAFAYLE